MKKRILLVDDELHNLHILRIFLISLEYEVFEVECGLDAIRLIDEVAPDLILLDVMLPDISGFDLINILKDKKDFDIPIIFLSARVQREDILYGLETGGFDYLTKPFDLDLLEKKVRLAIEQRNKLVALREENRVLSVLAYKDILTGLYNRTYLSTITEMMNEGIKRYVVGMMIDIDYFKNINDEHGHIVGDQVLQEVSRIIVENINMENDIAIRYGGDEFLILLNKEANHMDIAESIIHAIQSSSMQENVSFTASIGVTVDLVNLQIERLIAEADKALFGAKNSGRNQIYCF